MAIKIIYGLGGSGKSFFQMHVIVKKLRETPKNICTNLAIDPGKFNAYLERKYPEERLNLIGRLRILTEEETKEFWKYRGPLKWDGRDGREYDMTEDPGINGVVYVIDEAGAAGFSAEGWAQKNDKGTRGGRCLWYLDQQRKFSDDVFASTNGRQPNAIAKPFRDKAHGFIRLKNGYLATYGPFKGRGRFEWAEFASEPTGQNVEDIANGTFELGELAECYRTQDGVGVIGKTADKGERAKGIPIMWVIPAALVLALGCVFVPYLLGKGASKFIGGAKAAEKTVASGAAVTPFAPAAPDKSKALQSPEVLPPYPTGYVVGRGKITISMSDGTTRTESDKELQNVERNSIVLAGEKIYFRPAPASVKREVFGPDFMPEGRYAGPSGLVDFAPAAGEAHVLKN